MIRIGIVCVGLYSIGAPFAHSLERPSPRELTAELGQHWAEKEFDELKVRADEVYAAYPGFIPAIIAASFIDGAFLGKLYDSRDKVLLVKEHVDEQPEEYHEVFVVGVGALFDMMNREIEMQEVAGRTPEELEASASPAAVREAFGPVLIPFLSVLAYAPDEGIPPEE